MHDLAQAVMQAEDYRQQELSGAANATWNEKQNAYREDFYQFCPGWKIKRQNDHLSNRQSPGKPFEIFGEYR